MRGLAAIVAMGVIAPGCAPDMCPVCDPPVHMGNVAHPDLFELSGIAASFRLDDVIYAHNDSGDRSRFFALSYSGAALATYEVDNAENVDWEEIARAPCGSDECLYIADIGDNELARSSYTIYRVEEPTENVPGLHHLASQRMQFTYPEGSLDAEVLLVHPVTGAMTIVTKPLEGPTSVYELGTFAADAVIVAEKIGEFQPPNGSSKFTGGSIHPDAGVLLRTNTRLFHYPMQPEQTAVDALDAEPCQLALAAEEQGEAVTWLRGGAGIMTIEEAAGAAINVSLCEG